MVIRKDKKNRKFHGTRRWGVGNIKNARGAGGRGGVGDVGRLTKHDFTYITAKAPWMLRKKGFTTRNTRRLKEITLRQISDMLKKGQAAPFEFKNYKVLSNGVLEKGVIIKAAKFSKNAAEKIRSAGGQAIVLEPQKQEVKEQAAGKA